MPRQPATRPHYKVPVLAILGLAILIALAVGLILHGTQDQARERTVTILAVNDVYRLDGVGKEQIGGLHRLRTLRKWIERNAPNTLLLHAGDFLSPSLESSVFKGEQMIDAMNNLDGDAKAFDTRMFVAFGNHEFDDSDCRRSPAPLPQRIAESQFTWLVANLDFAECSSMKGIAALKNVRKTAIVEVGRLKVGIFGIGLTPDIKNTAKYPRYENELEAARGAIRDLRAKGADLVVALTHLERGEDEALIRGLRSEGLDVLVGGHDHSNMTITDADGTVRGFKADSDARTAWRIDVRVRDTGGARRTEIEGQLIALNEAITPDRTFVELAQSWWKRTEEKICADRARSRKPPHGPGCLATVVGRTQTLIELDELANRSQETGFGDWLADVLRTKTEADVAIVNSGVLGLNVNLEPNSDILLRHVVDIFRFNDVIAVREFPASQVCDAVRHGFGKAGSGAWPHVSGVEVKIRQAPAAAGSKTLEISVAFTGDMKHITCDGADTIKVAALPYLLCGGDDYPLFAGGDAAGKQADKCADTLRENPVRGAARVSISEMAEAAIRQAGDRGIEPKKTGRVEFVAGGP